MPPNGQNYYYVDDKQIDSAIDAIDAPGRSRSAEGLSRLREALVRHRADAILFYPQDVIAVNPKLKGFDATTYKPVFYPRPEHWTIEGAGADATAAFASWQPPS